jgi:hypothetical protein
MISLILFAYTLADRASWLSTNNKDLLALAIGGSAYQVNGQELFNAFAVSPRWSAIFNFRSDPYSGVGSINNGRQRKARRETTP